MLLIFCAELEEAKNIKCSDAKIYITGVGASNILKTPTFILKPIPIEAMHTIEHLFANWLKTESDIKDEVISFNPAGCQTMFYLEVFNDIEIDVKQELIKCIDWCLKQNKVCGATKEECGNYKSHNLEEAKKWLKRYEKVLFDRLY